METEQLDPAANVAGGVGHVDVCPKSPEMEMSRIVSGTAWTFFRVTIFGALVVVMTWVEKITLTGESVTGAVPVPLSWAIWGEFAALSVTVRVPECAPAEEGLKITEIVQATFGAKEFGDNGQLEVSAKSVDVEIAAIVRGVV